MTEESKINPSQEEISENSLVPYANISELNEESLALINQIIAETDEPKKIEQDIYNKEINSILYGGSKNIISNF